MADFSTRTLRSQTRNQRNAAGNLQAQIEEASVRQLETTGRLKLPRTRNISQKKKKSELEEIRRIQEAEAEKIGMGLIVKEEIPDFRYEEDMAGFSQHLPSSSHENNISVQEDRRRVEREVEVGENLVRNIDNHHNRVSYSTGAFSKSPFDERKYEGTLIASSPSQKQYQSSNRSSILESEKRRNYYQRPKSVGRLPKPPTGWEPAEVSDSNALPGLIDADGNEDVFNAKLFHERLVHWGAENPRNDNEALLDDYTQLRVSEENNHKRSTCCKEVIDLTIFGGEPLSMGIYEKPIVQAIFQSDPNGFLQIILEFLRNFEEKDTFLKDDCFGEQFVCSLRYSQTNPLHLAMYATPKFLKDIISKKSYTSLLQSLGASESDLQRYEFMVSTWRSARNISGLFPIHLVAEQNQIEHVHVFLEYEKTWTELRDYFNEIKIYHYDASAWPYNDSLQSHLLENDALSQLSLNDEFYKMMRNISDVQVEYAWYVAFSQGNRDEIQLLKKLSSEGVFKNIKKESVKRINVDGAGKIVGDFEDFVHFSMPPESHVFAKRGLFELFDKLSIEEKQQKDCYKFSALTPMLQFTDEQVCSQLKNFRSVHREDMFVFISQIIVLNRKNLLDDVLNIAFSNPENFSPKRTDETTYEEYGLPEYVSLPMETALERTEDMTLVEQIAKIYAKCPQHAKKLREEDALRCIRSIQDRSSRCSDQLRLAVIFMMLKFVDPFSEKYLEIMKMHSEDRVSKYTMKKYSERRSVKFEKSKKFVSWVQAFNLARSAVEEFGGSVENDEEIPLSISSRNRNNLLEDARPSPASILITKEKKALREIQKESHRKPKLESTVMNKLAKAISECEQIQF